MFKSIDIGVMFKLEERRGKEVQGKIVSYNSRPPLFSIPAIHKKLKLVKWPQHPAPRPVPAEALGPKPV